ncbi:MAG: hypothetical protein J7604_11220 [Sporocytophaga sp.]|uniref:hypothetical protein n=1 Tax=Sporocytophaga sp. TaxID=2231183 RepID=UPI001B1D04EE|nr:hypothetical protein [Sporocytophaga sp.]MBO9700770.1 hypothetical protein [Sporocytophaga sp.]
MFRKILFSFLLVSIFCFSAQAQSKNLKSVLQQLSIKESDCYKQLVVEKSIPYALGKSVLIVPKIVERDGDEYFLLDGYILIIDSNTGKILNKFFEKEAWTSDAIVLKEIKIDFAPYKLGMNTRAFGVRIKFEGSSRYNPYVTESISLFVPDGSALKRVLKSAEVYSYQGEYTDNCLGEISEKKKVIIISESKTNNYNDLTIKSTTNVTTISGSNGDCKYKDIPGKPIVTILKFNGTEYK